MATDRKPEPSFLRSVLGSAARSIVGVRRAPPEEYHYNHSYLPGIALADTLPECEKPTLRWYVKCIVQSLRIARNRMNWAAAASSNLESSSGPVALPQEHGAELDLDHLDLPPVYFDELPEEGEVEALLEELENVDTPEEGVSFLQGASASVGDALRIAARVMHMGITNPLHLFSTITRMAGKPPEGRPASVDDYRRLYTSLPLPWPAERFGDDETFAWLRVAGANPLVIQRVASLDAGFPVSDAALAAGVGDAGDSLALAGKEGRLFLADYAVLAGLKNGTFPHSQKYGFAPRALFALPRGTGPRRLRPVAIQCGQDPARHPVFTPADGLAWQKAKLTVEVADGIHHEASSHLARTHLLVSPIVLATRRRLPEDHPVGRLLRPHFEGTMSINDAAHSGLLAPGNEVDRALAGTIESTRAAATAVAAAIHFNEAALPRQLEARGVTSADLQYPYRDDARLIWDAIERWVRSYVGLFYASDAAVAADAALAGWGAEIVAEDAGRLRGFGERDDGRITTVSYLVQALTLILFTSSAQHAAVNFPQADILSCGLSAPFAAYQDAPRSREEAEATPLLDMLPPLDIAMMQIEFLFLLGGVYHTRLGDYEDAFFSKPELRPHVAAFQEKLRKIQGTIAERNRTRFAPYTFLSPELIPQSINM